MAQKKKTTSKGSTKTRQAAGQPAPKRTPQQSLSKSKAAQRAAQRRATSRTRLAIGGVALVVIIALVVIAFQSQKPLPAEITVQDAYEMYEQGAFLLDVREQDEWDDYHIPNTTLIPLSQLEERVDELPGNQQVVVVCNSGNRSQEGRNILLEAGFEDVTSMAGGIQDWRDAGYPIEAGTP